jgi:hypothetical protein
MSPIATKVAVLSGIIVAVAAVVVIGRVGLRQHATTPIVTVVPETIHTADWYLAHRDVLAIDEKRCERDAASIPMAACENVAAAVKDVDTDNAMNALQQAATSKK